MQESKSSLINQLNDGWLRALGIPLVAFIVTFFFYSEEWIKNGHSFTFCFFTEISVITIAWYLNRAVLLYLRKTNSSIEKTRKRISIQLLTSLLITALLSLGITLLFDLSDYWSRHMVWQDYIYNLIILLTFVFLLSGIYETIFYFARWRLSVREAEELKKANLQSQFESLKNQVSPHFLFNSLNTLSSLIEEDPDTAIRFVNQLSKVYRYLLQSNEKELTPLEEELSFVESYIFLLKTRFGEGINLKVDLQEDQQSSLIPPLTLQILIENAVKHNVVSSSSPLNILVKSMPENELCVVNNKQKKTINVASTGLGLANISAKYRLLNKPAIRIEDGYSEFTVTIPVIKNP